MRHATLAELGEFKNGVNFKADRMGSGFPLINVKDITNSHRIDTTSLDLVEAKADDEMFARDDDIFFVRSSVKLDGIALAAKLRSTEQATIHCGFVIRFRPTSRDVDSDYLLYLLRSAEYRERLKNLSSGAAIVNISQSNLRGLDIPLPSTAAQRQVADILSAYDDLIENNRRRMALLEKAARLLYEEWFVRLRFPGHERARLVGRVPEGWERAPLVSLCVDRYGIQTGPFGSQLHQSDYSEDGVPVVMPKNLIDFRIALEGIAHIPEATAAKLARHRVRPGDTLYGRRGDIGRRAFVSALQAGWMCGTGCLRIRPNPDKVRPRFLFDALGSPETAGTIANRAKGATMLNLNSSVLESVLVLVAPQHLQERYVAQVEPISDMIEVIEEQGRKLGAARDLLLPRLMSGELAT
ncbi:MAG: restriction endonuclease subunit S [Bryobacteraceae bacterium]